MSDDIPVLHLFIGNPGSGKSTIANGFIGEVKFKSGIGDGSGLTDCLQIVKSGLHSYGDTPGLSDVAKRKHAAQEIAKALQSATEGHYKIVFVLTMDALRIRPDDIFTINSVLSAVPDIPDNGYGIIINKIPVKTIDKIMEDDKKRKVLLGHFFHSVIRPSNHFCYLERIEALEDQDNQLPALPLKVKYFVDHLPRIKIDPKNVGLVESDHDKVMKKLADSEREWKEEQAKLVAQYEQKIHDAHEKYQKHISDVQEKLKETQQQQQLAAKQHAKDLGHLKQQMADQAKEAKDHYAAVKKEHAQDIGQLKQQMADQAKEFQDHAAAVKKEHVQDIGQLKQQMADQAKESKANIAEVQKQAAENVAAMKHKLESVNQSAKKAKFHHQFAEDQVPTGPVTIRNYGKNELLYATAFHYDNGVRRHAFTWSGKGKTNYQGMPQDVWNIEKCGDSYKIRSCYGEYLYAAAFHHNDDGQRRWVFEWSGKGKTDYQGMPQDEWNIEKCGDSYAIRSCYGEYLYAAHFHYNPERRYVFASSGKDGKRFTWMIRKHA